MEIPTKLVSFSLGSNLGDKKHNITVAINKLDSQVGKIIEISDFFISKPLGFFSENNFVNCCCNLRTNLGIQELISITQRIENEMGRQKLKINKYEDRIIDIDIIFFDNEIINCPEVRIPHTNFRKRDFVLFPLKQLSNRIDPETFITIDQFTK
ncbi:MAG: 2-amino-4-hydroxy-6-hydroxymethyldihydropteridine diphosphokinase [Bacteroidetes bacterium]|nr:2-amino-4-hydroxy-6-hydroxymethyldihydropteridine diphosphokinase [Bacteroidota bacterium]